MSEKNKVPFSQIIESLLDTSKSFPPMFLHRFSDLNQEDHNTLTAVWHKIDVQRRVNLMEALEELYERDTIVQFTEVCHAAVRDSHPLVRSAAIRLLSEEPKISHARIFMRLAEKDSEPIVRAEAVAALGQFIFLGELEKIPAEIKESIETLLLNILGGKEEALIRRQALESLGYSEKSEVPALIEKAYNDKEIAWVASALVAMGRSMDSRWEKYILQNLTAPDPEISFEAIRAAGHMELQSARNKLLKMLNDFDELEEDIQEAIIWSLSEIGGEGVRRKLESLLSKTEDGEASDFIETALENLEFTEGFKLEDLFDINVLAQQELNTIVDLELDPLDDDFDNDFNDGFDNEDEDDEDDMDEEDHDGYLPTDLSEADWEEDETESDEE